MSKTNETEYISNEKAKKIKYLLVGLIFFSSVFLSIYTQEQNNENEREEFKLISQQVTLLINDRMDYYTQLLLGGVGLFSGSDEVTREDWKRFSEIQHLDSKFLGIQGVGYAEVIKPEELQTHIQSIQAQGFPHYSVKPKGERELYTSIVYIEPFDERNIRAFGYDMYSQQTRHDAMKKAIESGMPSLSGKVRLLQENGVDEQAGFLLYTPVYKKEMPLETPTQRYEAIEGVVYSAFRAKNLFVNIAGNMTQKVGVEIFDGDSTQEDDLLIRTFKKEKLTQDPIHYQESIDVGNHIWTLRFTATESKTITLNEASPWIILVSGGLLSTLLFLFLNNLLQMESKQKRYLDELKALSFRKTLALKAGVIGIWEWEFETNTLLWDEHMYEIYGFTNDPNGVSPYTHWSDSLDERDKARTEKEIKIAVETNQEFNSKFWIVTPNGERKYIHSVGLNELDSKGKALRMVGTNIDITEQKLVELQLSNEQEAILQVKTAGFFHLKDRTLLWTNATAEEMLGYNRGELQGKDTKIIYENEESYLKYGEDIAKAIANNETFSDEIVAIKKDGTKMTLLSSISKLKGSSNEAMGVVMDITHQKQLEQNLQEEVEKKTEENFKQFQVLQEQSKLASMGEMIGAIAHQWRQPLNEISIRIQKIKYKFASDKIDEEYINDFVEKNKKTIDFMSKTIDDFRNFFRIDKEKKEFNIKEAIEEIINIQTAQLKNHHIEIGLSGQESFFVGYKSEFQQVIMNLVSNAKDAFISNQIPEPKILIKLDKKSIIIQDNAGGIDEDIIERIFEPYFTTKEQGEGTGMGLYMSKMIIEENMSGKLEAKNRANGIEISISL